jgi:hypothetical protein
MPPSPPPSDGVARAGSYRRRGPPTPGRRSSGLTGGMVGSPHRAPVLGRLVAAGRPLPDFLLIGAQRSGTTALFAALGSHPDVQVAVRKEVHYFDLNFERGTRWYRAHFPRRREGRVVGEATPYYLAHPEASGRAGRLLPDARLIACLREPTARAWSQWAWNRRERREDLGFLAALRAEPERLAADERTGSRRSAHQQVGYLDRGRYAAQLERWLSHFDSEQLLILRHEDLWSDPATTLARVQRHLGLSPRSLSMPAWAPDDEGPIAEGRAWFADVLAEDLAALRDRHGISWPST